LTKKQKITTEDLANTPLIVREGQGTTQRVLTLLEARSLKLNVALRCASPDAVKAAVRRKMGIGILFHHLIEDDVRRKEFKIIRVVGLPRASGNSYIVYNKTKPLSRPATAFLAILHDITSKHKTPIIMRNRTGTDQAI
jgi:DNA-binding transcriptional LysR family regulator